MAMLLPVPALASSELVRVSLHSTVLCCIELLWVTLVQAGQHRRLQCSVVVLASSELAFKLLQHGAL